MERETCATVQNAKHFDGRFTVVHIRRHNVVLHGRQHYFDT